MRHLPRGVLLSHRSTEPWLPQEGGIGVGDGQAGEVATGATLTSRAVPGTLPAEELVQGAVTIVSKHTTTDPTGGFPEEGESEERPFPELERCQRQFCQVPLHLLFCDLPVHPLGLFFY